MKKLLFALICIIALVMNVQASAQSEDKSYDEYTLEDTVVTATKTGETDLQTTGISMTVFDDEYLSDLGIYSLYDLDTYVSGFEFATIFGNTMSGHIRGIGTSAGMITGEAGISYYRDGVYLNQGRGAAADFLDLERVEILKGPQGVLFGGNATGGALNFITKKPTDELEMMGRVEVGNYATRRVDARIAGPLIEGKVRGSLTVMDAEHDGWIDNLSSERDARDQNDWGVRGAIQILPSDSMEVTFSADYTETEVFSTAYYEHKRMYIIDAQRAHMDEANAAGYPDHYLNPLDFWTINTNAEQQFSHQEIWGVSLHMEFGLPHDMTLRSITAYREQSGEVTWDADGWIHIHNGRDNLEGSDQTSQELTLNGTWGQLEFLVGGFYLDASVDNPVMSFKFPEGWLAFQGSPMEGVPINDLTVYHIEKENWALFTNLSYAVTDKLNLSAGVRFSHEWKGYDFQWAIHPMLPDGSRGPFLFWLEPPHASEETWTVWTPKFAIEYQANDNIFLFASYAEGFKGGMLWGQNARAGLSPSVGPEYVETWELGVKTDWLDKRLRVNAAVFTNDHTDSQEFFFAGNVPTFQNIGAVESTGAELEIVARPIQGLTLMADVTYLDPKYSKLEADYRFDDLGPISVAGNRKANIPEWKATLNASYTLAMEDAGFLTFGTNIAYRDDVPTTPFEQDPYTWIDDYTIVNATIRYETEDGRWAIEGYARNLFETKYFQRVDIGSTIEVDGLDATYFTPGNPRRVGIKVTYTY